jgi:toxin ParE1/3/4
MLRVHIRPRAVADLREIYEYLLRRNARAADRFIAATALDFDRLAAMPGIGAPRRARNPSLKGLRSRTISGFRNYIIFFLPAPDGIEVIRVYHGARDIDRLLGKE